jgi:hypothetical protein
MGPINLDPKRVSMKDTLYTQEVAGKFVKEKNRETSYKEKDQNSIPNKAW